MKEYIVKKLNPASGGIISWKDIPSLDVSQVLWLPDPGVSMSARLCHDSGQLFVSMTAKESNIRQQENGPLDQVCNDSCMEFFLDPLGDGRYFNFEFNPMGNIYLGYGRERGNRARLIFEDYRNRFSVSTVSSAQGWSVSFTVPLSFLNIFYPGLILGKGAELRANFYKCGDKTVTPHYLAWNSVEVPAPDFHRPEYFGKIILE